MRGITQCYECFAPIAEACFAIQHKKTRRLSAPDSLVGNTGLAAPFHSRGGIHPRTRHRVAMPSFFLFQSPKTASRFGTKKPGAFQRRVLWWAIQKSNLPLAQLAEKSILSVFQLLILTKSSHFFLFHAICCTFMDTKMDTNT